MIELKIKSGESIRLTPIQKEENVYELVDEQGVSYLDLSLTDEHVFKVVNPKDIIEDKGSLESKLHMLAKEIYDEKFSGIENDEEAVEENDPFDPEEISIDKKTITMETCLRRLEQDTLKLNPDFQRQEVWTDEKKSQLIESLMLKIPIPMFYVSSDEKQNLTVVDGLQRLSTIRDFMLGKEYLDTKDTMYKGIGFRLSNLEFWKDFEGKCFNELPTHIYNRIIETEFTFTIINPGTPEEVRRNIFKRLNTGGMPLSSQEIRNALYIGKSTVLLNHLAKRQEFLDATCWSIKSERMEDRELILRFIAFVVRGYTTYIKTISVDTWLSDTMIILNALPALDTKELNKGIKSGSIVKEHINVVDETVITETFIRAMKRAGSFFGDHAFRKSYPGKRRTPINKSLFETWGVLLSNLSEAEFQKLQNNKERFMKEYKPLIDDPRFVLSISKDSMRPPSVKSRFEVLSNLVNKNIRNYD